MIDLAPFYEGEKFFSDKCWETCGGSHCCKLHRLTKDLKFAPRDEQVLHLYPFEYDWLVANKQLDPVFAKTTNEHRFKVDNLELRFYSIRCGYGGTCPNHKYRPIGCFLYPYIPYFQGSGEVERLANLSIFDDLYDRAQAQKPCTLFPKFTIDMYKGPLLQTLAHPEFYFYTNLYIRVKEAMVQGLKTHPDTKDLTDFNELLMGLEMLHTLRLLTSAESIKDIVREEARKFKIPGVA